jgi:hypothetical protein
MVNTGMERRISSIYETKPNRWYISPPSGSDLAKGWVEEGMVSGTAFVL